LIWNLEGKKLLVKKYMWMEGKHKTGSSRNRMGWDGMDWIHPTQVRE
jgi:hypothetical protein